MRVIEDFGADHLTLVAVIQAPTVAQLAELLEQPQGGSGRDRIERRPPGTAAAPSIGQEALWFLQQLDPEEPFL